MCVRCFGTTQGIKAIRQGGSYASSPSDGTAHSHDMEYYQWEKWTGPAWTRPSRSDGRETPLFAPFIYNMHHFTKTGSGQTYGKLKKRVAFP